MINAAIKMEEKGRKIANTIQLLYAGELNPVAPQAQKKVPVPEGLNLDAWINEPISTKEDASDEGSDDDVERVQSPRHIFTSKAKHGKHFVVSATVVDLHDRSSWRHSHATRY